MDQAFAPDEVSFSIIKNPERLTRENIDSMSLNYQIEIQKKIESLAPSIDAINKKLTELDLQYQALEKRSEAITESTQEELNQLKQETQKNSSLFSVFAQQNDLKLLKLEEIITKEALEIKLLLISQQNQKPVEKPSSNPSEIKDIQTKIKNLESILQSLDSKTEKISEFLKNQNFTQDPTKETPNSALTLQYVQANYSRIEYLHNSILDVQGKLLKPLESITEKIQVVSESVNRLKLFEEYEFDRIFNKVECFVRISEKNPGDLSSREKSFTGTKLVDSPINQNNIWIERHPKNIHHGTSQSLYEVNREDIEYSKEDGRRARIIKK